MGGAWLVHDVGWGVSINDVLYYYLDSGVVGLVRLDLSIWGWVLDEVW